MEQLYYGITWWVFWTITQGHWVNRSSIVSCVKNETKAQCHISSLLFDPLALSPHYRDTMSDKSDLKAELERKKQRLAQIREEKKRKEEERKKKEVRKKVSKSAPLSHMQYCITL